MQPLVSHTPASTREEDYRLRSVPEPKSWISTEPVIEISSDRLASRIYTHNAERFGRREPVAVETAQDDVEPSLGQPPHWMMMLAGAAVAALMGALLGGFMHI